MIKNKSGFRFRIFFISFLLIMLILNFIGHELLGLTHFWWHLFLHTGIIVFSFLILIYSLNLPEKAMKYIITGCVFWIIVNCIVFLGNVFEEYYWLETNLFTFLGMIVGGLLLMFGFKEAVNG